MATVMRKNQEIPEKESPLGQPLNLIGCRGEKGVEKNRDDMAHQDLHL